MSGIAQTEHVGGMETPGRADLSEGVAFMDGAYLPIGQASIPITDWGFTRSDVTYDVVHVWDGAFFRLDDHLDRFEASCASLRLSPGVNRDAIARILMECVSRSGLREAYVEMLCTRGSPPPGSRDPRACKNRFAAFAIPYVWVMSPEKQAMGGHIHISSIPRISPQSVDPTVKNFHWADLTRGLFQALDYGADTVVLVDAKGNVSEGPGFNIFCVTGGRVTTPEGTVLEGITRKTVRELCGLSGIEFFQGAISPQSMRDADEVFLSSTAGGIMPITRVDDRILSNGRPGPVSVSLRDLYWSKHAEGWHATPVDYA